MKKAMIKKIFAIVWLFFVGITALQAQNGQIISGNVSDTDGPLMMVNVVEYDKDHRIIMASYTDMNGNFSLRVKNTKDYLEISFMGYETEKLEIGSRKVFNIKLQNKSTSLGELQVTAKKKTSTGALDIPEREVSGAMQKLSMNEFEGLNATSVDELLQGRISGLDIVMNSGNLGSGTTMRLRGVSSINGNSDPLIVVNDNIFKVTDDNFDFKTADTEKFADLLCVNPDDIESIQVLKDAAATAIWGSQGSNGVISIKTKRGQSGRTNVQYSYRTNITYQPDGIKMLNGDDYTMLLKEEYFNPYQSQSDADIIELNYNRQYSEYHQYNNNTDWIDAVKQVGWKNSHYISIQGGGEKASFRIAGGYDNETGSIIGQELNRFTTRVALDYYVSDRIKITSDFNLTYTDNDQNYSGLLGIAYKKMPNLSIYEEDANENSTGRYYYMQQSVSSKLADQRNLDNPVALAHLAKNNDRSYSLQPQLELQYNLLSPDDSGTQLRYNGRVVMDVSNYYVDKYYPRELSTGSWSGSNVNSSYEYNSMSLGFTTRHTLTFTPKFANSDHFFTAMARFELNSGSSNSQSTSTYGTPSGNITSASAGGYLSDISTGLSEWRSIYISGSAHYSYKSKYSVDFTIRRDGCTKFGDSRRWGNFPSLSGRWNIIDENWMKWSHKWLSMLSIRPGWGIVGTQPGSDYSYYSVYSTGTKYIDMTSVRPNNIRLTDLKWEQKETWNLGTDLGFFDDKLTINVDLYTSKTSDLLMYNRSIPTSTGFGSISSKNVGSMRNKGWEFNIEGSDFAQIGKFKFSCNLTFGNNVNEIVSMDDITLASLNSKWEDIKGNGNYLTRIQLHNAFGSIYGFRYKGVYQYSDYSATEVAGLSGPNAPVARDAAGNVIFDEKGKPLPMYFDYNKENGINYKFRGGDAIYEDVNHDGNINELDIVYLGNCNPKVTGGFGFKVKYKRLAVNAQFVYRYGGKILNTAKMNAENMYSNNNQSYAVNWRWRTEGDITTIPRALYNYGYNYLGSDRFVESGSFLRFNYLQLSYSFDPTKLKPYGIKGISLSASANNIACWTKYSGVDPEVSYGGYGLSTDNSQTPRSKYFTGSLSITF